MQDYACGFSQEDTRMWWEGQGSISSSQTDGEFYKVTTSTRLHVGVDYWTSTPMIPKVLFLFVYFNVAKNIWFTVVKS